MNMPPYQPPVDATLVDIAPFGPPELGALVTALSAHLDNPTYQIIPGGAVRLRYYVWAPEGEVPTPAAQHALYAGAEEAIAAIEALGWTCAAAPEIALAEPQHHIFESAPTRIGARVTLTLTPA